MNKGLLSGIIWFLLIPFTAGLAHGDEGARVKLPNEDARIDITPQRGIAPLGKANAALARFVSSNPNWEYRMNPRTGNFHRAWGEGIQIEGFHNISLLSAPQAADLFVKSYASTLNLRPAELRMLSSNIVNGKAYVKYAQTYNGIDVLNTFVDLRISPNGKVFMFGSDFHPDINVVTRPSIALDAAKEFAKAGLEYRPSNDYVEGGALFVLPLEYPTRIEYRLVYNFQVYQNENEIWETYIDAHSGVVLWRYNLVHSFAHTPGAEGKATTATVNGQVLITIFKQSWLLGATTVPAPFAYVNVGGKMYVTDADGRFTADLGANATAAVITRLSGPYALARRADSSVSIKNAVIQTTAISGQDLLIEWNDQNSVASERNAFYQMTAVRNFVRGIDGSDKMTDVDRQLTGLVNINDSCNANWNGTRINFFKQSFRCGNTAEISDVVIHEYGHAVNQFLYTRVRGSGLRNGTIGEATSDILANMLLDDPRIGIGFMKSGGNDGIIRNSDNKLKYPNNIVNEIHDDGMILTGAVWDMRKAIGLDASRRLTHFVKYGTPDGTQTGEAFADYFIEILVADDDDGNLANGTPHSVDIIPAFRDHGIPGCGITIKHTAITDQSSVTTPYDLTCTLEIGASIRAGMLKAARAEVVYSTDKWATSRRADLTIDASGKVVTGQIPPQKAGSIVRYYVEITDNYGSFLTSPDKAPEASYLFLVGFQSKMFYPAEVVDGWKVAGDVLTGKWLQAIPIGTYNTALGSPPDVPWVQPNEDHTPGAGSGKEKCWVTGNAQASLGLGENDVDEGSTMLTTRTYDISQYINPVLRYYRWYSNDAGATPGTDYWVVRISSDGGATWTELENTNKSFAYWSAYVIPLQDIINSTSQMVVEFTASDIEPGSLVEAAVDDFEILDIDQSLVGLDRTPSSPGHVRLDQNYPNPVSSAGFGNAQTSIRYSIPAEGSVTLRVYSSVGQLVRTLASGVQSAGDHIAKFNALDLPSGTYTYELSFGGTRITRMMLLMK
jgi:Zn-dependent metalloprotease